ILRWLTEEEDQLKATYQRVQFLIIEMSHYEAAILIWKIDKFDFVACMGAFLGVVFASVEIGLLIAVSISFAKILLQVTRPRTAILGRIPMTSVYRNIQQYPEATKVPGVLIVRVDSAIYFSNSNYIKERTFAAMKDYQVDGNKEMIALGTMNGKKNKKLFWVSAIAPLISVILSTLFVYISHADKQGVATVKHIEKGINPPSVNEIYFSGENLLKGFRIGIVAGMIALTVGASQVLKLLTHVEYISNG
nr:sulfate transporter 1.3-like [Tanacetum cinerariifolium]